MKITEIDIFDLLYEPFKFDTSKPIKLFEAFSGIGTQHMALKQLQQELGFELEVIGISEVDRYAIMSYEAIHGETKNYGGIGSFEKLPPGVDIATWSFPCQDISLAGQQRGMTEGTQSNYGYEFLDTVERSGGGQRPKVLLMENVRALFSEKFKEDWREIQIRLEKMGYKNYAGILNARNYGVAQNRDRVFIVSILGDYNYTFPKGFKLKKRLKDYLEKEEVDEKYYLSDKMLNYMMGNTENVGEYNRREVFMRNFKEDKDVAATITTMAGNRPTDNFIIVPEASKKGYRKAYKGDGVYIDRPYQKRGVVQSGLSPTIKTQAHDIGVVVEDTRNLKEKLADELIDSGILKGGEIINHSYTNAQRKPGSRLEPKDYIETDNGISPTLTTRPDTLGYVEQQILNGNLRIRKFTERETWRLMGIKDEDFEKAEKVVSATQLYKQAGNAIVVDVLYHIFKQMF